MQAQQFSRYDDMRIRAPENWKPVKVYSLDVSAGGNYMNGNVDSVGSVSYTHLTLPTNREV